MRSSRAPLGRPVALPGPPAPPNLEVDFPAGRSVRAQVAKLGLTERLPEIVEALGLRHADVSPTQTTTLIARGGASFVRMENVAQARPLPTLQEASVVRRPTRPMGRVGGVETRMLLVSNKEGLAISEHHIAEGSVFAARATSTDRRFLLAERATVDVGGLRRDLPAGSVVRLPRGCEASFQGAEGRATVVFALRTSRSDLPREPSVTPLDEAQSFWKKVEGCEINVTSNRADDPCVSIVRARVSPEAATNPHAVAVTERYLITSGEGVAVVGGKRIRVGPGDLVSIPAMVPQYIENAGPTPLVFAAICCPRFEKADYFDLTPSSPARTSEI